ncbi:GIP, partial [Symbiodinium sp. CCMP2592]
MAADGAEAGPEEVPVAQPEDQGVPMEEDGAQEVEAEARPEVRIDEEVREPTYEEPSGHSAAHGSHGNHGGTPNLDSGVPPSGRQRPIPGALSDSVEPGHGAVDDAGGNPPRDLEGSALQSRPASRERRAEDVGQVARSLAYMTSLVTTLVGRMDRVEQAQSRNGSSASGRQTTTATSARMETPMGGTPEAGALGWVDLNRLDEHLAQMNLGGSTHPPADRPLASLESIMAGTFSSDDTEMARARAEQGEAHARGVPGALLGPLAEPLGPVVLAGRPGDPSGGQHQGVSQRSTLSGTIRLAVGTASKYFSGICFAVGQLPSASQGYALASPQVDGALPDGPLALALPMEASGEVQLSHESGQGVGSGYRRDESCGSTAYHSAASRPVPESGVVTEDAPPGLPAQRGQGLVIGAPASGLVYAEGAWRPYVMVQGQMVIQNMEAAGASAVGLFLAAPTYTPANLSGGTTSVPGPVPPPPPSTPSPGYGGGTAAGYHASEVEEPSKLVMKLPPLVATKGQDAAVVAGDWLAQLEPSMSSLSSSAASWWQALMERVRVLYTRWLESTPILRLQIRQEVLAQRPALDKYQRVEQRASMLLLDSLPEDLRAEVVSVRAVTVEAMVFLVHCSFQPGGSAEKAYLLQFLTAPESGNSVDTALSLARKWVRLLRRGKELQVVLPDPSLLCRGLDKLHGGVFAGNKHPSAAFRIASFKLERQLDYKAIAKDVEDYAQLILGELEAALLAQPLPSQPKLNRMEETVIADAGKGKAKGKARQPCWAWSLLDMWEQFPPQAAVPIAWARGGKKGGGKAKDAVRKAEEGSAGDVGAAVAASSAPTTTSAPSATPGESAREDFFEEAAKALKSLRLARATLDRVSALGEGAVRRALVDSGATTSMRSAGERELQGLPRRKVLLAEGEAVFYQLPGGTLLTEKATAPILAMSDLMEIGCRVVWSSDEGCHITHPVRGNLCARIFNGCPELEEQLGLDLIAEAEATKFRRREAELMVNKLVMQCEPEARLDWEMGTKAVKDLRNGVGLAWAWLYRAFPEG